MLLAEACDAIIIGDQRTGKLDGRRDEESISWIAVLKMVQLVGAGGGDMTYWLSFKAGAVKEAIDPRLNRNIKLNTSCIDEQRDLSG